MEKDKIMVMETVKLKMDKEWEKDYGVSEVDYNIDFVTDDQNCTLHDGTKVDIYHIKHLTEDQRMEFLFLAIKAHLDNNDKVVEGAKYAKEHGIQQGKWFKEPPREQALCDKIIYRLGNYLKYRKGWKRIDEGYSYDGFADPKAAWRFGVDGDNRLYVTIGNENNELVVVTRLIKGNEGEEYANDNRFHYQYPSENEMDEYGIVEEALAKYKYIVKGFENIAAYQHAKAIGMSEDDFLASREEADRQDREL